jgi:hypothetical protein
VWGSGLPTSTGILEQWGRLPLTTTRLREGGVPLEVMKGMSKAHLVDRGGAVVTDDDACRLTDGASNALETEACAGAGSSDGNHVHFTHHAAVPVHHHPCCRGQTGVPSLISPGPLGAQQAGY